MLSGTIGKKVGITQVFVADGSLVPVTVIEAGPCTVVQRKTANRDKYSAVQLGFGKRKPKRVTKAEIGHTKKSGKDPFVALREFRVTDDCALDVGTDIRVEQIFEAGDRVDVTGISKGHGTTGVVKRYGFRGFPASHGTHEYFRHGGAIGNRSYPGRVFKGKRMAGRMGVDRVTIENLTVVEVKPEEQLLIIRGSVPGVKGRILMVRKSRRVKEAAGVE